MAIVVCYVVPFVFYLTAVLGNTVKWRVDPSTNRSIAYSVNTSWFPPDGKIQKYLLYYLGFISQPLFFIVVVVCSVVTVVNLRKTYRKRLQMTGARTEEGDVRSNKITTMLLCLCVIYTVIFVPRTCAAIIYTLFPEFNLYRKYHNSFFVVYQIFMLTASCVNSAVNFFAYLALSSKFRRDLKEVCSCFSSRLSTAGHQR
ncbi:uncharacterized protein LOC143290302 [Babylonia areolata]|uniref:uncharacterized protein LOC143290302 n=1 Tax=Babylonia areolata TaxID=304850 RepID=UPI003FD34BA1